MGVAGWEVWKQYTTALRTGVVPRVGVGEPKGVDFELQGHEKSRPAQLTPSDPEFEGRAQSYKAGTGRLNSGPEPG